MVQTSNFQLGDWQAQANLHEVGNGTMMAVISACNIHDCKGTTARHTVVFDDRDQRTTLDEKTGLIRRLLQDRYTS